MRSTGYFKAGEVVTVKTKEEILATLDERGELDGLPFMPEKLEHCGKRLGVFRRAVKTCVTVHLRGMHEMKSAVHLEGARCSGRAHGGCEARCMLFWKESWLRSADAKAEALPGPARCDEAALRRAAMRETSGDEAPAYRCQATEMPRAAPKLLPWWDVRQYALDLKAGNKTVFQMCRSAAILLFNKLQSFDRKYFPGGGLIRGAQHWPFLNGPLHKTPSRKLDLRPGDVVRVRSRKEIVATLTPERKNRGLLFDAEMAEYCGKELRVLARVNRILDEKTGRMIRLESDCVILKGAVCTGKHYQFCPRSVYPYWREVWLDLERRAGADGDKVSVAVQPAPGEAHSGRRVSAVGAGRG